MFELQTRIT